MGVLKTNLVGKKVCHNFIGEGVIRKQIVRNDQSTDIIEVEFPNGESKKFNYPTIFLNFLAMSDENDNAIVQKDIAEYNKIIAINKPSPTISNSGSGLESTAAGSAKSNREPITGTRKKNHFQSKNIAFKCTYNDGGKKKNGIGFSHVCSDTQLRQNIKDGRSWCSHWSCPCRQYFDGDISRKELDSYNDDGYVCYESVMLVDWVAQAGMSNPEKPKDPVGIKLKNAFKDSIAILTTRLPGTPEQERIIFGLFIIADFYEGDEDESGYVSAHNKYRLMFTAEEGMNLKFWKYYSNKNNPSKPFWGTGLFRYITEDIGVQILRDTIALKAFKKDGMLAKEFLQYYCEQNRIDSEVVGEPMGALTYGQV